MTLNLLILDIFEQKNILKEKLTHSLTHFSGSSEGSVGTIKCGLFVERVA
jgi:hypothetical protein